MEKVNYRNIEIRKLPPSVHFKLGQLLEVDESWKKLLCSIPSVLDPKLGKYTMEHLRMIERYGEKTLKNCGEILLDEWSTSGQIRPKTETLYELLLKCQLFRIADYVAVELLDQPIPIRPLEGPSRTVETSEIKQIDSETPAASMDESTLELKSAELVDKINNWDLGKNHQQPINFDIDVIQTLTNNFSPQYLIGEGAFGRVFRCDFPKSNVQLAIKLLHPSNTLVEDQFITEIESLSDYRHTNLVSLIGFSTNGPQFCLIYEYLSNGSLLSAISVKEPENILKWVTRFLITEGIVKGLNYLHFAKDKPLIHRDIKSANILLDKNNLPKIGDFGLARSIGDNSKTSALTSTIMGTSAYMAPEAFRGDISPKMDVFSYGVIILELLTGLPPFDEEREEGNDLITFLQDSIENNDITPFLEETAGEIEEYWTNRLFEISQKCLEDKRRRIKTDELLKEIEIFLDDFNKKS